METIQVGPYTVEVSHTDRVLLPQDGITKGDLIDYYRRIAGTMLPYVKGRPAMMQRFPNGIDHPGFVQKEAPDAFPDWITRVTVEKEGGHLNEIVCDNAATLVYLANLACITPHVWLSRIDRLHYPDRLIFDLDPPDDNFARVCSAARLLRGLLEERGIPSSVMTTGSRGLHVLVPLDRSADFDTVRTFAQKVAERAAERDPEHLTTEPRKEARRGRLFLDTFRNSYAQLAVPPYAVRAKPGAPVATPLDWSELDDPALNARRYDMRTIFARLERRGDAWAGLSEHAVSLPGALDAE